MNATRFAILGILVSALVAGVALYYLQVYAYYTEVAAKDARVELVSIHTGQPEQILFDNFKAIDSDSSPLRYRACFHTDNSLGLLTETYVIYDRATPLNAPGWFDCFNSKDIGAALETGEAVAFLSKENIVYGFDQVAAVLPDGRGFVWHQINHCGERVFDGEPAPEGCPPVPEGLR